MSNTQTNAVLHAPDDERAVLGAVLLDNALIGEALQKLTPEDFHVTAYRRIFRAMIALDDAGVPIEAPAVAGLLREEGALESCGGTAGVFALTQGMPRFSTIRQYIDRIKGKAMRRQMHALFTEAAGMAFEGDESNAAITGWFEERWARVLAATTDQKKGPQRLSELIPDQLERFALFHRNVRDAVPTGFPEIDSRITGGGLGRGMGHILAARTSMGKTAMALDIAVNAAKAGYCVYVASLEMMKVILADRIFSVESGVERHRISPGLSNIELSRLVGAATKLEGLDMWVDDSARSVAEIRRAIRDVERSRKVDLVVVDYLQLMDTEKGKARYEQIGQNSRALQGLVKEFNAAGLFLAQLSREHEQAGREPDLVDLRESGDIEQDARAVFLLFGDKGEETEGRSIPFREITFKCAKQGEGTKFRVVFPFDGPHSTFRPIE